MAQPVLLAQHPVERRHAVALVLRERPAVGPLGESLEGLEVARLGLAAVPLDPADGLGDDPEVVLDRPDRQSLAPSRRAFAR